MADKQDAALMIQLAQWASTLGLQDATRTIFDDGFDPNTAQAHDDAVNAVLTFGETVGTLTKHGLLDDALVLDWLWVAGLWERVAPAALAEREKRGVPQLFENFETLAAQQM